MGSIENELSELRKNDLFRTLRALPQTGGRLRVDGRDFLNFSSNDYLDLAGNAELKAAATSAIEDFGCGATASRLMTGHLELHECLEKKLASFVGGESALLFGSGFLTNLGVMTALTKREDIVFADRLNHASLIDGMRLGEAKWERYKHKDLDHLESLLQKNDCRGKRLIVSDSVFSMDGDIAPLEGLAELARRFDALLIIDEAHAVGVFGAEGGGVCCVQGHEVRPDLVVGTLSKAFGGYGGFAVCSKVMRDYLINRARSFIYSTGLPPACVGSAIAAVDVLKREGELGAKLLAKAKALHSLLTSGGAALPDFESQILPVPIGENDKALEAARLLFERGIIATAIRPPTVPKGTARLRLSVTLAHTNEDLEKAAELIIEILDTLGAL